MLARCHVFQHIHRNTVNDVPCSLPSLRISASPTLQLSNSSSLFLFIVCLSSFLLSSFLLPPPSTSTSFLFTQDSLNELRTAVAETPNVQEQLERALTMVQTLQGGADGMDDIDRMASTTAYGGGLDMMSRAVSTHHPGDRPGEDDHDSTPPRDAMDPRDNTVNPDNTALAVAPLERRVGEVDAN